MINVIVYEKATGKIRQVDCCPPTGDRSPSDEGMGFLLGTADVNGDYVDVSGELAVVRSRQVAPSMLTCNAIATTETATLTGPEGATVTIFGPVSGTATMDADGLEISSDIPGTYTVKVSLFPYLDAEYSLEITEP